ncbi:MAG: DUF1861 family protein [Nanoarchaeota archaeon]|nr:DUF1861 family protein [Nanoarchaeota archaeon]
MKTNKLQSIKSLLRYYNPRTIKKTKKLKFVGVENREVYNITAPFRVKRKVYLIGRVELREHEQGTRVIFFRRLKHSHHWHVDENCPVFDLQDPFIFKFRDLNIFGGVEVIQRASKISLSYRTVFYKGKDIHNLKKFSHGPWGMKGIRFISLPNTENKEFSVPSIPKSKEVSGNKIGVFTRPQGKRGRRGKIGFEIIDSLQKLNSRTLSRAGIIKGVFTRGEWGGINEVHFLKNNKLGVLGHIARFSKDKKRYYYPITFMFDYETKKFSGLKIIAARSDLPHGEAKRDDLYNVIYPGGIIRNEKDIAKLYVGVGDAESYEITIEDPFSEYEYEG